MRQLGRLGLPEKLANTASTPSALVPLMSPKTRISGFAPSWRFWMLVPA
jgi:hypothetical protein